MTIPDPKSERLTEFERAVCYDTLPQVTRPLTFGMIAVYASVLLASLVTLTYAVRQDRDALKLWSAIAFAATVIVGLAGFTFGALRNAVRRRAALAEAEEVPNVQSGFDELPDPFAGHALLRYYRQRDGDRIVTGNRGETAYTFVSREGGRAWIVQDPSGEAVFRIEASAPSRSFSFDSGTPAELAILQHDTETARVSRRWSFGPGRVEISGAKQPGKPLLFRGGGLFDGEALVGRVYSIRNYLYLDVKQSYLDDGLLAFFACMLG